MKSAFVSGAFGVIVSLSASTAFAQGMPSGSYSSWSEAQKQQAATFLGEHCQQPAQCGGYIATARSGVVRASYEAAACVAACFASNLPADYPDIEEIKQVARTNADQAKKLGSGYEPRFVPSGEPDAPPK